MISVIMPREFMIKMAVFDPKYNIATYSGMFLLAIIGFVG